MVPFIGVITCALLVKIATGNEQIVDEPIPAGILLNTVTYEDLIANKCSPCYSEYYHTPTTSTDISSCAGPVLFVGAIDDGDSVFSLGAYGLASEVQTQTALNTPHLSNGVYWYFTSGYSFGFLKDDTLQQSKADVGSSNPEYRLSWFVDSDYGGYRAGSQLNISDATWQKVIWSCPNGTLQCTVSK